MKKLRVLDLFSGIGGFSLGLERTGGFETVAFCEVEPFPRKVLAKHWPDVPCFEDVRKLTRGDIDGPIDVICGGYPCQPFSTAGRRLGKEDDRHLWPEFARLVAELRPTWVIGENVAGHISMGLDDVLSDLEGLGYAARPFVIPAVAVDAKHRRNRIWTVAHSEHYRVSLGRGTFDVVEGCDKLSGIFGNVAQGGEQQTSEILADTSYQGLQGREEAGNIGGVGPWRDKLAERCAYSARATWRPEPNVGRVANGVPNRVDRLKALGNAVVPQIPEMIGYAILEAERNAA